jgi:hypothetical protein
MIPADAAASRKLVYALLITVAAAGMAGRILSTELVFEPSVIPTWPETRPTPMPTFSSNDRSRWATIRALVENGTYEVGERVVDPKTRTYRDKGIIFQDGYKSVDKLLIPKTHKFYSTKPPLLPTLVAGEYWLFYQCGSTMDDDAPVIVRTALFTVQWLPVVIYLLLLARLVERYGRTDWGRYYVLAAACFGTLVTLFVITLNNHTVGVCSVLFALYPALRIWSAEKPAPVSLFLVSGFFTGFTVCNELPAAAFAAALGLLLLWREPRRTLAWFAPAAAVPLAAFLLTNYLAIGEFSPAYSKFGGPWYEYEGSHWKPAARPEDNHGIDWARLKETRAEYALHVLVGHHGLFSLSPIYLLAFAGMILGLLRGRSKPKREFQPGGNTDSAGAERLPFMLYPLTFFLTVVVIGFYLFKSDNYGGWTNGLRWLMWLTPLWLLCLLPVVDYLAGCRWGRGLAYVFLAVSVLSVSYRSWNAWRHPWLYNLLESLGWPGY